jgi:hypothetical protein
MRSETGVGYPRHLRMQNEPLSERLCVLAMTLPAERQSLKALQQQE